MRVDYVLLVFLPSVFMVCALSVNCMTVIPQCPNCTAQYIEIINASTGRCVECWPCPKCNEGRGSSVPCGATVTFGTPIQCVLCVPGTNFSDITGTSQCQPCGMCSGQHESVLSECSHENDIMCKCDVGFFRNKTTQECLPCASCCSGDHNILEHCHGDAIKTKCKFEEPWPLTCSPSVTAVGTTKYLSVLATSSSLMSFSYKHSTATPVPGIITKITPAPSETVHIKATLASFSRPDRHTKIWGISTINKGNARGESHNFNIVIPMSETAVAMLVSVLVTAGCVACVVCIYCKYRSWRAHNNPHALQMTYELEARDEEERKSSECSGVDQRLLQVTEHPPQATTSLSSRIDEGKHLLPDIPPSHENEPQNLGQWTRKRLASEGDDNSAESDLEGHQPQFHIEGSQDGLPTTPSSLDRMSVCSDHQAALPSSPPDKPCSSSNIAASSGLTGKATEQSSQLSPVIEKDMGLDMANQRAVCRLSVEPPIQSTEDNRGYNTHIKDVSESVIQDMCMLLDEEREIDGKDYKLLASELELPPVKIRYLKELKQMQGKSPSYVLLMHVFSAGENLGTLHHLHTILKKMGRFDVIKVLDDWVLNNS